MLKNKIYTYFINEIFKSFLIILFALTIVAWTVRSVNFLDLIVDDGHSLKVYGMYSLLNITNVLAKFIPLSFLIALMIFIIKQIQANEFIILWTSGVKKLQLVNLFFITSLSSSRPQHSQIDASDIVPRHRHALKGLYHRL